jgi:hypothetical protein
MTGAFATTRDHGKVVNARGVNAIYPCRGSMDAQIPGRRRRPPRARGVTVTGRGLGTAMIASNASSSGDDSQDVTKCSSYVLGRMWYGKNRAVQSYRQLKARTPPGHFAVAADKPQSGNSAGGETEHWWVEMEKEKLSSQLRLRVVSQSHSCWPETSRGTGCAVMQQKFRNKAVSHPAT